MTTWLQLALTKVVYLLEQKSLAKGAREARPFVDEAIVCTFSICFAIIPKKWPWMFSTMSFEELGSRPFPAISGKPGAYHFFFNTSRLESVREVLVLFESVKKVGRR